MFLHVAPLLPQASGNKHLLWEKNGFLYKPPWHKTRHFDLSFNTFNQPRTRALMFLHNSITKRLSLRRKFTQVREFLCVRPDWTPQPVDFHSFSSLIHSARKCVLTHHFEVEHPIFGLLEQGDELDCEETQTLLVATGPVRCRVRETCAVRLGHNIQTPGVYWGDTKNGLCPVWRWTSVWMAAVRGSRIHLQHFFTSGYTSTADGSRLFKSKEMTLDYSYYDNVFAWAFGQSSFFLSDTKTQIRSTSPKYTANVHSIKMFSNNVINWSKILPAISWSHIITFFSCGYYFFPFFYFTHFNTTLS